MSDEHPPNYFRKKTSSKMFDRIVNTPLVTYAKFHFRWKHHRPGITAQKMKFAIMDFFRKMWPNHSFPANLVTFTEEISNGKLVC